jgi:hypothetical protein
MERIIKLELTPIELGFLGAAFLEYKEKYQIGFNTNKDVSAIINSIEGKLSASCTEDDANDGIAEVEVILLKIQTGL